MSSGATHSKASLALAAGFSLAAMISMDVRVLECVAGALVGIVISPDLDLSNGGIVAGKLIRKKVGWFGERAWKRFWKGYSDSFKHGTWASHSIFFSTLLRVFYVYYWVILIPHMVVFLSFSPHWDLMYVLTWYVKIFLSPPFLFGLMSSDLMHIILDKLTKEHK